MDNTIELEILGLTSNHSQSGSFTLVLGEMEGRRRLPIVIGMFEAQAIAIEIEKIIPELVSSSDPKSVNYNGLIGFLIEAIKEMDIRLGALEK